MKYLFGSREALSKAQLDCYKDDGFLLVSGLILPELVECAQRTLLTHIGSTPAGRDELIRHPSVLACFSQEVCSAAAQLAGSRRSLARPATTRAISVFPTASPWQWPSPHIDHGLEKDAFRTFPAPFRLGCLIYLNHVRQHMGATIVWPASHLQLEALAETDPKKYEYVARLNRDIPTLSLRNPVEITANSGDVLFYHRLCAHSGSMNTGREPRLAISQKW